MGFIGNLFSGSSGMGFKPQKADIQTPATTGQANQLYGQVQQGLGNQAAFLQALQGQGGIGNQSAVFQQQQNLANQLQNLSQGAGPNPAMAQLANTTGQNIANTTAAMASARGASANPAAIARSAGMAGANAQQQAAGQAAGLRAQQQLNAMNALAQQQQAMGNLAGTQVGQQAAATNAFTNAAQNAQQNTLSAINAQNQANVGMQSNINQVAGSLANTTAQGQQGLLGGLMGGAGSLLGLKFAEGGKVNEIPEHLKSVYMAYGGEPDQTIERTNKPRIDEPSRIAPEQAPAQQTGAGALQQGMQSLISGASKRLRSGEDATNPSNEAYYKQDPEWAQNAIERSGRDFGEHENDMQGVDYRNPTPAPMQSPMQAPQYLREPLYAAAKGGKVPALLSPGEKYLTPDQAKGVVRGEVNPMEGKTVPGKAKVKGNSYANDTVPATLEEGGIVIPRSVMQSDRPMENAIKFVHQHMKKMAEGGAVGFDAIKKEKYAKGGHVKKKHKHPSDLMQRAQEDVEHPGLPEDDQMQGLPEEHQRAILKKPHFIFAATNPIVKPELDISHDDLLKLLEKRGYPAEEVMGRYSGNDEPESILVHNVKPHHVNNLMKIAKQLGQESVIYSKDGKHEAHMVNGPNEGKYAIGEGSVFHEKEPDDNYTKTRHGLIFSHNIDWGNLYPQD